MAIHSFKHLFFSLIFLLFVLPAFAQPAILATLNTPANAGSLSEGCDGPYTLVFTRPPGSIDTVDITIQNLGVALEGSDYTFPPGTFPLQILPGQLVVIIPVTVIADGPEGTESLIWKFTWTADDDIGFLNIESSIVDDYDVEINGLTDTIEWCRYAPLQLTATANAEVIWSPTPAFTPSTGTDVIVAPFASGWYYASIGTEECGDVDSVYIDLAIANINGNDTLFICKDAEGITLPGQLLGLLVGHDFTWIPSDSTLSDTNSLTPNANPDVTTTYILQSDFGVCIASDTVVVRVDSLPKDLHIEIAPLKPYYCQGEIVALFSPLYDSLKFPDLVHEWRPDNGTFKSDLDILNASLELRDTTLYIRQEHNNACVSYDSILINVITSSIPLSVNDTMLCPGESFQVEVLADQVHEPEWNPPDGLSCTQCLNPVVTVFGTPGSSLFYQFSGMILDCPVGASLSIQIPDVFQINIEGDLLICEGDVSVYTITNPQNLTDIHWNVTSGSATLSCTDCISPTVTITGQSSVTLTVSAESSDLNFCGAFGGIVLAYGGAETINVTGDTKVCEGDVVPLSIQNAGSFTDIQWQVTDGNASLSCTQCLNPTVTINDTEAVTVTVTGESTNPDFCSAAGQIILFHGEEVQYTSFSLTACEDGTVIGNVGDPDLTDLHWEVLQGDIFLSCNDCEHPTITVHSNGKIRVTAESPNPDTCKVTVPIDILIANEDAVSFMHEPADSVSQGSEVIVTLLSQGAPGSNYMWTVNGQSVTGSTNIISFNADDELNFVEVHFTNSKGCDQVAYDTVATVPPYFEIPNAFTPNGDEFNELFRITLHGNIEIIRFQIFNRWGQLVYKAGEDNSEGWDGNFKGQPANSDTYVYTAEFRYPNGRVEVAKGDVMLLK